MEHSRSDSEIALLAAALAKAQAEIKPPPKNKKVDFADKNGRRVKYNYADLADCIAAVREPLSKNGLAISHAVGYHGVEREMFGLVTSLFHSGGGTLTCFYPLPDPMTGSIKAQEFGSALTYARRYSLCSLVGIASDDDDDGGSAADTQPPANKKPPAQVKPPIKNNAKRFDEDPVGFEHQEFPPDEGPPPLEEDFPGAFNAPPLELSKQPNKASTDRPNPTRAQAGSILMNAFNSKFILEPEQRDILQRVTNKNRANLLTTAEMIKVTEYVQQLTANPNPNKVGAT